MLYEELFIGPQSTSRDLGVEIRSILRKMESQEEKSMLSFGVTEDEIEASMNCMKYGKATGPDGFTTKYYKHSW